MLSAALTPNHPHAVTSRQRRHAPAMRRFLAPSVLAAALVFFAGFQSAHSATFDLPWTAPDRLTAQVVREIARRVGAPPTSAFISVIEVDLDTVDGLSEFLVLGLDANLCSGGGCPIHLLALVGNEYRDLLAGDGRPMVQSSVPIQLDSEQRRYWLSLRVLGVQYVWDGETYVDVATIRPTDLDTEDFVEACRANEKVINYGGLDDAAADALCACTADGFERRGQPQSVLDVAALEYREGLPDTHPEKWLAVGQRVELVQQCLEAQGLAAPPDVFPHIKYQMPYDLDVVPFFQTCVAQDWLAGNSEQIGTPDRALGFCHCLSEQLEIGKDYDTGAELTQADIDIMTRLFAGEIRDDQLGDAQQATVAILDRKTETCISVLPGRADASKP